MKIEMKNLPLKVKIEFKDRQIWKCRKAYIDVVAQKLYTILKKNGIENYGVHVNDNDLWPNPVEYPGIHYLYVKHNDTEHQPCKVCCGDTSIFVYPTKKIFKEDGEDYPLTNWEMAKRIDEWIFNPSFYRELRQIKVPKFRNLNETLKDITSELNNWLDKQN